MILPANAHVAVVDGQHFLLMRNRGTATEPRLETEAAPEVAMSNKNAGMRHMDDRGKKQGKEDLEKAAHAAGVAEWLNKAVLDRRVERLVVIADPETLGEMRRHYSAHLQGALLGELDRQLVKLPGPELVRAIEAV
jgi:protein required for attachment to host cells